MELKKRRRNINPAEDMRITPGSCYWEANEKKNLNLKKIKFKCWVEDEGEKFYGPGPHQLIKSIQKEGSLSKAAGQMKMSYKKAWDLIQRLNNNSEEPWVILKKGGQHGGGAEITPHAIKAMQEYEKLQQKVGELLAQQEELIKVLSSS